VHDDLVLDSSVQVRPATWDDRGAVAQLAAELAQSFVFSRTRFEQTYAGVCTAADARVLLALRGDDPVGYLLGVRHHTFYANGPVASVEEILVREQDRGEGTGHALMWAFERWAATGGCVLITLATRRAEGFYLALGYEKTAISFRKVLAPV
jgi:GNAT superfamily N-acetyltransferase